MEILGNVIFGTLVTPGNFWGLDDLGLEILGNIGSETSWNIGLKTSLGILGTLDLKSLSKYGMWIIFHDLLWNLDGGVFGIKGKGGNLNGKGGKFGICKRWRVPELIWKLEMAKVTNKAKVI